MPKRPPIPFRPQPNPQTLRDELLEYIQKEGFGLFQCEPMGVPVDQAIWWDFGVRPDYKEFFVAAKACGAKLIYFFEQTFTELEIERVETNLEIAMLPEEERRTMLRRLADFRGYIDFLCRVGVGFEVNNRMHWYDVYAPWFFEYLDLVEESKPLSGGFDPDLDDFDDEDLDDIDDDDDEPPPFGRRYHRN